MSETELKPIRNTKCKRHKWLQFPVCHYTRFNFEKFKLTEWWRRDKGKYCFNCGITRKDS